MVLSARGSMINYSMRFAQPWLLYWLIPACVAGIIWRLWVYKKAYYRYSLATSIASAGYESGAWHEHV